MPDKPPVFFEEVEQLSAIAHQSDEALGLVRDFSLLNAISISLSFYGHESAEEAADINQQYVRVSRIADHMRAIAEPLLAA